MRTEIIEARKRAIERETDGDRSIAIYLSTQGMAQFVMDELTPQQLMMAPEIMENAAREGIDKSFMGSTHEDDTLHIDTPLTEEHIDKLQEDIDAVFIEMTKHKRSILQREHDWSDEYARTQDVPWDIDVAYCKQQWGGWQLKEIHDKMDMIADFARIDRDKLHLLYDEFVPEEDTLWPDYDLFYVYTKGSTFDMKKYVYNFVLGLMDDGFIEDMASEYGEPGYVGVDDTDRVITANWNGMSSGVYDIIEDNGFALEWSESWACDYENDKMYRTDSSGPGWEPSIFYTECEMLPIEGNEELYISMHVGHPRKLINSSFDMEKYGFIDLEETCHEHGYYGSTELPDGLYVKFQDEYEEIITQVCSSGPWAVRWKVWGRNIDA